MIDKTRVDFELDRSRGNGKIQSILRDLLMSLAENVAEALESPDSAEYRLHWRARLDATLPDTLIATVMLYEIGPPTRGPDGQPILSKIVRASVDSLLVRKSTIGVPGRNEPRRDMPSPEAVHVIAERLREEAVSRRGKYLA